MTGNTEGDPQECVNRETQNRDVLVIDDSVRENVSPVDDERLDVNIGIVDDVKEDLSPVDDV